MIQVQNISKAFKDVQVLTDINIDFFPGKVNFIIGRSGQGKSVLLKCMVGLLEPNTGSVLYDGVDFLNMDEDQHKAIRQEVGMLFQGAALFDSMTLEENVMFPLTMFSNLSSEEKLARVNECLERVNLVGKNKLYPAELSGGMKKEDRNCSGHYHESQILVCRRTQLWIRSGNLYCYRQPHSLHHI